MLCCFFRFRDQEFLKSLQSQKQQSILERLFPLFPRLSILRAKLNDIACEQ